ncbi:uncharacterized protein LOC110655264 [Hevea brasiliensis]|uniref:uncharacterized protein LOC110655264 n=1 Tax=Hevea brasiliensis TaxID=3981 RepID=UPI0025E0AAC0|nr:uncharacterized protein LOC110655264 [Hevea brasiliensis]
MTTETKATISTVDPTSHYYLSTSENPGIPIVRFLLTGDLNYKNCLSKPDKTSLDANAWDRCNSMVMAWIVASLEKRIRGTIMYAKTAKNMWEILKQRYSQVNAPHVHKLRREISLLQQGNLSVTDYFNKLQELWDELASYNPIPKCTCGAADEFSKQLNEERIHQFLMGLDNHHFGTMRSQILNSKSMKDIDQIYAQAVREERQSTIITSLEAKPFEAAAFHAGGSHYVNKPSCSH